MAAASAVARRAFADAQTRTVAFALLFLLAGLTQATAYCEGYPTLETGCDSRAASGPTTPPACCTGCRTTC